MKLMRKLVQTVTLFAAVLSFSVLGMAVYVDMAAPEHYYNIKGEDFSISGMFGAQVSSSYDTAAADASSVTPVSQDVQLSLFGIIPVKTTTVETISEVELTPCGTPFGVKILTDGVIVVGLNEISTAQGTVNPAKQAGIQTGDIIYKINGTAVSSNDEVAEVISACGGKSVSVDLRRNDKEFTLVLQPALSAIDGSYKAGLWVRDSSAGIGTVSFYDPATGAFGGLGHAICDVDTGEILPVMQGDVVNVKIHDIVKGTVGTPGELRGSFVSKDACGTIYVNNESGVFGQMFEAPVKNETIPMGLKQEVHSGKATVYTTINGNTPKAYEIEIEKINLLENSPTKNMIVRITDPELLELCGGIVQGMSGSPIVQDGKLIGAVTHVFVNDPTRGYAIFAENMYQNVAAMQKQS